MKAKGEEGSREWFRYLRGDKVDSKIDEIIVRGERIQNRSEIAKEIKLFWEDIGGMNANDLVPMDIEFKITQKDLHEIDREIDIREIEEVLKKLKLGKAAGMDEVPYEMYEYG